MLRTGVDAFAATIARLLIGGFFALSGANNLLDIPSAAQHLADLGIPLAPFVIVLVAIFKLTFGIFIMIRYHTKVASLFLIAQVVIVNLFLYNPMTWLEFPLKETIFMRNVAILGGLLFLYAHSRGVHLMRSDAAEEERLAARKILH